MKKYEYDEPAENGNKHVEMTEQEILNSYYDFWKKQMIKVNKQHLISKKNCIEDWVIVNWAWEVK